MIQILPQEGTAASRIGAGFGRGLADQVPKEIERHRLASGLKNLSENKEDLSPFQRYSQLLAIPGITPQGIQSGAELLRQEGINKALIQKGNEENRPRQNPFIQQEQGNQSRPGTTQTTNPTEETLNNRIPKSFEEIQKRAGQLMASNPALYGQDPDKALSAAQLEEDQSFKQNQAFQLRRENQQKVEDNIEKRLEAQRVDRKSVIPEDVFKNVRDEAIDSIKSKDKGGQGFTEKEAENVYSKKVDEISREYQDIKTAGSWGLIAQKPSETNRFLDSLSNKFASRNDERNLASSLIAENNLSPMLSYSIAFKNDREPELNKELSKIPNHPIKKVGQGLGSLLGTISGPVAQEVGQRLNPQLPFLDLGETLDLSKKIAPKLGKKGSILSVAKELKDKGYDPQVWLNYVTENQDRLNLTEWQKDELTKQEPLIPTLGDLWLGIIR